MIHAELGKIGPYFPAPSPACSTLEVCAGPDVLQTLCTASKLPPDDPMLVWRPAFSRVAATAAGRPARPERRGTIWRDGLRDFDSTSRPPDWCGCLPRWGPHVVGGRGAANAAPPLDLDLTAGRYFHSGALPDRSQPLQAELLDAPGSLARRNGWWRPIELRLNSTSLPRRFEPHPNWRNEPSGPEADAEHFMPPAVMVSSLMRNPIQNSGRQKNTSRSSPP